MDVKEAISKRRSIRKYQRKEVSLDLIREMIDAARLAPSGSNAQPCRYYLVKDNETKEKLRENQIFEQDFVYQAPVLIVCCADVQSYMQGIKGWSEENQNRALRDLSIASAFLVLRATELGLATCYVGWMKKDRIKDVLGIPRHYIVPFVIAVGYANEQPEPLPRKSIDEVLLYVGGQQK
jgi:nitroreductase